MFGLGPASSAHHLLAHHHNSALEGAAGLHLARYNLTNTKEEFIIGLCFTTTTEKSNHQTNCGARNLVIYYFMLNMNGTGTRLVLIHKIQYE